MRDWFKARNIWGGAILSLSDAEAGRLAKALWEYTMTGAEADLPGAVGAIFAMFLMTLRQDAEADSELSAKRAAAGSKGGNQKQANVANANFATTDEAKEANATNKNKNKEKEILTTTATAHARETDFGIVNADPVILSVQKHLNELTETHYDELQQYRELLGDELVLHAIDETVGNGVHNWSYASAIMQGYVRGRVKTVAQAKERSERRKQARKQTGKTVSAQQYTQRHYSEGELEERCEDL